MKAKTASIVIDYTIYPRSSVDSANVANITEAIRSGATMPPIIVERHSLRVVDGVHRLLAAQRLDLKEVEVETRAYDSEADLYLDATALNATHGHNLTPFDRARVILHCEELHIDPERIARALNITVEKVTQIKVTKVAFTRPNGQTPVKPALRHLAGLTLTKSQGEANRSLGGNSALFYINQVIRLIECKGMDMSSESTMTALQRLQGAIEGLLASCAAAGG